MKVKYIGYSDSQVRYDGMADPRNYLQEEMFYFVSKKVVHRWCTEYHLEGFPGLRFNSVYFELVPSNDNNDDLFY